MSITAIICEYNPFHNGHAYHLAQTKQQTEDPVLCLMSGEFVQRGEAAIQPTLSRAQTAVENGAELVLTLPFVYSCTSARTFALGAVKMLDAIRGVRRLSFGIEHASLSEIHRIADCLYEETPALSRRIRAGLDEGFSFPRAQARAVADLLDLRDNPLDYPNNTLAVEYLRALRLTASAIEPLAIPRVGDGYAETEPRDAKFASATAVRAMLARGENPRKYLPAFRADDFADMRLVERNFYLCLREKILAANPEQIRETAECAEGLEYRITDAAARHTSYETFIAAIKTKRYTRARLNRILAAFSADVRAGDVDNALRGEQLFRVPAFRDKELLSALPHPVLCAADADRLPYASAGIMTIERRAYRLYRLLTEMPYSDAEWFKTVRLEAPRPNTEV